MKPSKKSKSERLTTESLQWRSVKASAFPGMDEGGGMMMLEELDDVDIEWEEDKEGRKVARFIVGYAIFGVFVCTDYSIDTRGEAR